jgi:RES domain-containing protein
MIVFRICKQAHVALDGEGARSYGGRWNTAGKPAVYTSEHLSLATLEYLVHVNADNLPTDLVWLEIEVPNKVSITQFAGSTAPNEIAAATHGDNWLAAGTSLGLMVPSAVLSVEKNLILNPLHPEMASVKTVRTTAFQFDPRLFQS